MWKEPKCVVLVNQKQRLGLPNMAVVLCTYGKSKAPCPSLNADWYQLPSGTSGFYVENPSI